MYVRPRSNLYLISKSSFKQWWLLCDTLRKHEEKKYYIDSRRDFESIIQKGLFLRIIQATKIHIIQEMIHHIDLLPSYIHRQSCWQVWMCHRYLKPTFLLTSRHYFTPLVSQCGVFLLVHPQNRNYSQHWRHQTVFKFI